eukprot:TRINITY_DN30299_c0_g1_i1.p1 TRINITY_DN30299_c0_g1~~TRINITY_DN30299_c0_g1_i1.p1  ORF type:complete len:400 (+),score=99.72 TRINITY_DN30299_c0_g1_i1:106-1305(+)
MDSYMPASRVQIVTPDTEALQKGARGPQPAGQGRRVFEGYTSLEPERGGDDLASETSSRQGYPSVPHAMPRAPMPSASRSRGMASTPGSAPAETPEAPLPSPHGMAATTTPMHSAASPSAAARMSTASMLQNARARGYVRPVHPAPFADAPATPVEEAPTPSSAAGPSWSAPASGARPPTLIHPSHAAMREGAAALGTRERFEQEQAMGKLLEMKLRPKAAKTPRRPAAMPSRNRQGDSFYEHPRWALCSLSTAFAFCAGGVRIQITPGMEQAADDVADAEASIRAFFTKSKDLSSHLSTRFAAMMQMVSEHLLNERALSLPPGGPLSAAPAKLPPPPPRAGGGGAAVWNGGLEDPPASLLPPSPTESARHGGPQSWAESEGGVAVDTDRVERQHGGLP